MQQYGFYPGVGFNAVAGGHLFGGFERESAREHRQSVEQVLLRVGEQLVAPVQGCSQGLLARRRQARPSREQAQRVTDPFCNLLNRQEWQACRGQLQSQRNAIHAGTDMGHGFRVLRR